MKKSTFKSWQLFAITVGLALISHSCNKQAALPEEEAMAIEKTRIANETNNAAKLGSLTTVNPFNKHVGAPIDGALGDKWIVNYKAVNGYNKYYTLNSLNLQSIIINPDCVGICIYYAMSGSGKTHLIPLGVTAGGTVIKRLYIPTEDGVIFWTTAKQWINNYKGPVAGHFFGKDTFDRLKLSSCPTIQVSFALNDQNKPQLLLSNNCEVNLVNMYEDRSNPCSTSSPIQ